MNGPLEKIRQETDSIILFSSLTGKDSILMTHYCSQIFDRVISVYMYIVKDLEHVQKYQNYFSERYSNIEFIQVPHFSLSKLIRTGFYGIKQDRTMKKIQLDDIINQVRAKVKIGWVCLGMKKYDSIHRMFELKEMEDQAINRAAKRVYPLADLNNNQVIDLIRHYNLPQPVSYEKGHSQCVEVNNKHFIGWLYERYPEDLKKVIAQFPACNCKLYEYLESKKAVQKTA